MGTIVPDVYSNRRSKLARHIQEIAIGMGYRGVRGFRGVRGVRGFLVHNFSSV